MVKDSSTHGGHVTLLNIYNARNFTNCLPIILLIQLQLRPRSFFIIAR